MLKSVGAKRDFGHTRGCISLARYDFLFMFYSEFRLGGTIVEL